MKTKFKINDTVYYPSHHSSYVVCSKVVTIHFFHAEEIGYETITGHIVYKPCKTYKEAEKELKNTKYNTK